MNSSTSMSRGLIRSVLFPPGIFCSLDAAARQLGTPREKRPGAIWRRASLGLRYCAQAAGVTSAAITECLERRCGLALGVNFDSHSE